MTHAYMQATHREWPSATGWNWVSIAHMYSPCLSVYTNAKHDAYGKVKWHTWMSHDSFTCVIWRDTYGRVKWHTWMSHHPYLSGESRDTYESWLIQVCHVTLPHVSRIPFVPRQIWILPQWVKRMNEFWLIFVAWPWLIRLTYPYVTYLCVSHTSPIRDAQLFVYMQTNIEGSEALPSENTLTCVT